MSPPVQTEYDPKKQPGAVYGGVQYRPVCGENQSAKDPSFSRVTNLCSIEQPSLKNHPVAERLRLKDDSDEAFVKALISSVGLS